MNRRGSLSVGAFAVVVIRPDMDWIPCLLACGWRSVAVHANYFETINLKFALGNSSGGASNHQKHLDELQLPIYHPS
jgi:hypothetical protein